MVKELCNVKKGEVVRISGVPSERPFATALEDARFDRERGVCTLVTSERTVTALGHLTMEVQVPVNAPLFDVDLVLMDTQALIRAADGVKGVQASSERG